MTHHHPKARNRSIRLTPLALIPALALGLACPAQAAQHAARGEDTTKASPASAETKRQAHRNMRASRLIGTSVRNLDGRNVGQIGDLVVDMTSGTVRYAVLRFDPGILEGERLFAVPTDRLRMAADRDDVVFDIKESRLQKAAIERADWDRVGPIDTEWIGRIDDLWGVMQPSGGMLAHRASDLIGQDVNDRGGKEIGEIDDLVVDMGSRKVRYAVFEYDPGATTLARTYALPLHALRSRAGDGELVLEMDRAKLETMKPFTRSRYANLNDPSWMADLERALGLAPGASAGTQGTASDREFAQLDDDKDGWLNRIEARDDPGVDRNWKRLDGNQDGLISRQEFSRVTTSKAGER
jgi:sporulation protein YlmC with PRC-barrel domain